MVVWLVNWPAPDSGARTDMVCWSLSPSLGLVKGQTNRKKMSIEN